MKRLFWAGFGRGAARWEPTPIELTVAEAEENAMKHCRGRSDWTLLVMMFIVTALGVYVLSARNTAHSGRYGAEARIVHPLVSPQGTALVPGGDLETLEREILAVDNVEAALKRLGSRVAPSTASGSDDGVSAQAKRACRSLRLERLPEEPGKLGIAITYSNAPDARQAVGLVNGLAEQYVESRKRKLRQAAESAYREAKRAAQHASQCSSEAQAALVTFLQGHFAELEKAADELAGYEAARTARLAAQRRSAQGQPGQAPKKQPRVRENVEWLQVRRELDDLRRRRDGLLIDRTPAHPEIRDIDLQIERLTNKLDSIPRHVLEPQEQNDSVKPQPAVQSAAVGQMPTGGNARTVPSQIAAGRSESRSEVLPLSTAKLRSASSRFADMQRRLHEAQHEHRRLIDLERRAWEQWQQPTPIELQWATESEVRGAAPMHGRSIALALATALAATIGLGMIATGSAGPSILRSPEQAAAIVGAPVVGVVQAPRCGIPTKAGSGQSLSFKQIGLVASGATILIVCIVAVARDLGVF